MIQPAQATALELLQALFPEERRLSGSETAAWLHARALEISDTGLCVDVGAWCGWTACAMAMAGPTVLAVDTFRASDRWVQEGGQLGRIGGKREGTLDCYAHQVARATIALGGRIVAVQGRSLEAAQAMAELSADLVFLDADHSRAAVAADVAAWHAIVKPRGILCGHNWGIGEVQEAVGAVLTALRWPMPELGPDQLWWTRRP
jgi:hypothetical protein